MKPVNASMLYNLVCCPHRVYMDLYGDYAQRDPVNPFVQLLWERGNAFEAEVISGVSAPLLNLKGRLAEQRVIETMKAMRAGVDLIYGGRIEKDGLIGEPDLIRRCMGGYVAGDIKSGSGFEGQGEEDEEGRPKKHYAVQLALYTDVLERLGVAGARRPFIWDIHSREVTYELNELSGRRKVSLWDEYLSVLERARSIVAKKEVTLPAYGGLCKLCHWYSACKKALLESDDLTLIPELGRARRDAMLCRLPTRHVFAATDPASFLEDGKTIFPGIGREQLFRFHERVRLQMQKNALPYAREPLHLPEAPRELFFDVETDPMRDICYLHGFVERTGTGGKERYVAFFADDPREAAEEKAFAEAWAYVQESRPCRIYYYSAYERTIWGKLQKKYPHVASVEEIAAFFAPELAIDLYHHVVRSKTEWPTYDYSIKTLASFLGFSWRDVNPSGAASIEWYHRWLETGDAAVKQRILDYNEDDCRAMRVLLDRLRVL
ncbi:MAG: TM0106 family RecB-like putative nuclease [Smithellaceae bacterium]|nr:TM0106 family RecB-like putative nuclease [Smithellaceae bacterium]